ncbi:MAG: hypothetical protein H6622_09090 [Halobacteriovoraceae bacterium]|nr:hypothetical protein [Halobacteriovoraceae bacterium]
MFKTFLFFFLIINSLRAFDFLVGKNISKKIDPIKLRSLVYQGKDSYEGIEIVINENTKVPLKIEKKWVLRVLSSENIPKKGNRSPEVIFVKSF